MKKIFLTFVILLTAALVFGLLACRVVSPRFGDYQEHTYSNYAQAVRAGEAERGWLPEFTPETATDIRMGYDLDTNAMLLTFRSDDLTFVENSACLPTDLRPSHALDARWWPETMYTSPATRFFRCADDAWMAVEGDTVWYWRGLKRLRTRELARHAKAYRSLDGQEVVVLGYVDSSNVFDTRRGDESDTFALVPDFRKVGEDVVFVRFDNPADARVLLDEIHAETPRCTSMDIAIQLAVQGTLHAFEMPMNFNTAIGYNLQLHNLADVTFLAEMGDPLPGGWPEEANRIRMALPDARYPLEFAPEGWIQLQKGFAVAPIAEDASASLRVSLGESAVGDLNGDSILDAAAILIADPAGSGVFYHLTAALNENGEILPVDTLLLADRIIVDSLTIEDGVITLIYRARPEDAPMSAEPTVPVTRRFMLDDGKLKESRGGL